MTGEQIGLMLNGIMLLLLAATIFFSARLSLHLKTFRDSRKDMDKVIRDLADNVRRAEQAIAGLRETARESGRDLQGMINEARALSDELQIMSESGNSLAKRLERVSERKPVSAPSVPGGGFSIRDPEFGQGMDVYEDDGSLMAEDELIPAGNENLQSRAERELYEALRHGRRKTGAGGG